MSASHLVERGFRCREGRMFSAAEPGTGAWRRERLDSGKGSRLQLLYEIQGRGRRLPVLQDATSLSPSDPGCTPADPGCTTANPGCTTADPGYTPSDPGCTTADPGSAPSSPTPVGGSTSSAAGIALGSRCCDLPHRAVCVGTSAVHQRCTQRAEHF